MNVRRAAVWVVSAAAVGGVWWASRSPAWQARWVDVPAARAAFRPDMTRAEVRRLVGVPPGDYSGIVLRDACYLHGPPTGPAHDRWVLQRYLLYFDYNADGTIHHYRFAESEDDKSQFIKSSDTMWKCPPFTALP